MLVPLLVVLGAAGARRAAGGGARLDGRLRGGLDVPLAHAHPCARRPCKSPPCERSRRLGDLAARRGRAGEPRAEVRGLARRTRARGRGADHRGRRGPSGGRTRCAGSRGACPRVSDTSRRRRASRGHAPTSSTRRAWPGGLGSARSSAPPFVLKLTGDAAFERALRTRAFEGTLEASSARRTVFARACCARDAALRRAAHVVCPSSFLRDLALGGGVQERVSVLTVSAPRARCRPRGRAKRRLGLEGPTLAFAGRLTRQKALDVALEALARRRGRLARARRRRRPRRARALAAELGLDGRVRFLGAQPRERCSSSSRRGRGAALVDLGELPARGRRGARGRDARDRDRRRRRRARSSATARTACSSRRRRRGRWRRDRPLLRRRGAARAAARRAAPSVEATPGPDLRRLEQILRGGAG